MKITSVLSTLIALTLSGVISSEAAAQGFGAAQVRGFTANTGVSRFTSDRIRGQINNRGYGVVGVAGVNQRNFAVPSSGAKPFQSLNRGPSVSPYLALSGSLNGVSDYYNIVRPQQDFQRLRNQQQRTNERTQQQLQAQSHRLNQMAAAPPFDITGDQTTAPTGHSTTYMSFSSFQTTGGYFSPVQGLNKQR